MGRRPPEPSQYTLTKEQSRLVGARVRVVLSEQGRSQNWLARQTEMAPSFIADLMNGRRNLQQWQVRRIAKALGLTEVHLLSVDAGRAIDSLRGAIREVGAYASPDVIAELDDLALRASEAFGVKGEESRGATPGADARDRTPSQPPSAEVSAPGTMLPPGLQEYLEKHERELRPFIVDHLKRSRFHTEPWVVFDEEFWNRMVEFWEAEYQRSKTRRGGQS